MLKLALRIVQKLRNTERKRRSYRKMRSMYPRKASKEKILFWVPGGMPLMLHVEMAIAAALKIRGYQVHAIICDGVLKACVRREVTDNQPISDWPKLCQACRADCSAYLDQMGIEYSYIGDYIDSDTIVTYREQINSISYKDIDLLQLNRIVVGKNIKSSIFRFYKGYPISDENVINEYALSGLISAEAAKNALDTIQPDKVFMSHGTYVDWGPALHTAIQRKIPVFSWMASYLPWRFYFRQIQDPLRIDMHNISTRAWEKAKLEELTGTQVSKLQGYLHARYTENSSFDMRKFMQYSGHIDQLKSSFQLDSNKKIIGIFAHINWDCVTDYSPMLYDTFDNWIRDTLKIISINSEVQWLLKIHPAEAWDNPESGIESLVRKEFPHLPEHIKILGANAQISPLDFMDLIDGGVTVYGTSGLEAALRRKPILLAGEAHYGQKGFTIDCKTIEEYHTNLLNIQNIRPLDSQQELLAKKYAYIYFLKRQIPLSVVKNKTSKWWSFQLNRRNLLRKGADPVIDFICDRIVDGDDFIMSDELMEVADRMLTEE